MQTVWRAIRNDTPAHTPRCVNIHGGSEDLHKGHALLGGRLRRAHGGAWRRLLRDLIEVGYTHV